MRSANVTKNSNNNNNTNNNSTNNNNNNTSSSSGNNNNNNNNTNNKSSTSQHADNQQPKMHAVPSYLQHLFSAPPPKKEPVFGSAPETKIDPEEATDRLPQPYRMLDNILNQLIEAAVEIVQGSADVRAIETQVSPDMSVNAEAFGKPCSVATTKDGVISYSTSDLNKINVYNTLRGTTSQELPLPNPARWVFLNDSDSLLFVCMTDELWGMTVPDMQCYFKIPIPEPLASISLSDAGDHLSLIFRSGVLQVWHIPKPIDNSKEEEEEEEDNSKNEAKEAPPVDNPSCIKKIALKFQRLCDIRIIYESTPKSRKVGETYSSEVRSILVMCIGSNEFHRYSVVNGSASTDAAKEEKPSAVWVLPQIMCSVATNSSSTMLAIGTSTAVILWDNRTGSQIGIVEAFTSPCTSLAFHGIDCVIAGSAKGGVSLISLSSSSVKAVLDRENSTAVIRLFSVQDIPLAYAFTCDGRFLVYETASKKGCICGVGSARTDNKVGETQKPQGLSTAPYTVDCRGEVISVVSTATMTPPEMKELKQQRTEYFDYKKKVIASKLEAQAAQQAAAAQASIDPKKDPKAKGAPAAAAAAAAVPQQVVDEAKPVLEEKFDVYFEDMNEYCVSSCIPAEAECCINHFRLGDLLVLCYPEQRSLLSGDRRLRAKENFLNPHRSARGPSDTFLLDARNAAASFNDPKGAHSRRRSSVAASSSSRRSSVQSTSTSNPGHAHTIVKKSAGSDHSNPKGGTQFIPPTLASLVSMQDGSLPQTAHFDAVDIISKEINKRNAERAMREMRMQQKKQQLMNDH